MISNISNISNNSQVHATSKIPFIKFKLEEKNSFAEGIQIFQYVILGLTICATIGCSIYYFALNKYKLTYKIPTICSSIMFLVILAYVLIIDQFITNLSYGWLEFIVLIDITLISIVLFWIGLLIALLIFWLQDKRENEMLGV